MSEQPLRLGPRPQAEHSERRAAMILLFLLLQATMPYKEHVTKEKEASKLKSRVEAIG